MDEADLKKLQVEAWKTTIEVQQHFNDIEMKIRALAITVLTAILGAAALAVRDGTMLHVAHRGLNLGAAILIIGLVAWLLFLFVDAFWYHRLLIGAVKQGKALEKIFTHEGVPGFGLTSAIGDASPFALFWIPKLKVHSTAKIWIFYVTIAALLAIAAIIVGASTVSPATHPTPKQPAASKMSRSQLNAVHRSPLMIPAWREARYGN